MDTRKKIAITGGPCSGKTSAKATLMQRLPELGFTPIFLPETATLFLGSGMDISKTLSDPVKSLKFQELVFLHQVHMENVFENLAALQQNPVIICDRGTMDGAAYMEWPQFESMTKSLGLSLGDLMSGYDAVIHLVTAADGAPEFYNLDNPARYEPLHEAINVDKRLQRVWSGHPCLRIVPNVDISGEVLDFGQKLDRVLLEVCNILDIPAPVQTERRFLIGALPVIPEGARTISIIQTYLTRTDPNTERRIRIWRYGETDPLYFYTEKRPKVGSTGSRFKNERQISADEYIRLLAERDFSRRDIRKTRYCFTLNNLYFNLDIFLDHAGLRLLEVQASEDAKEFHVNRMFDVIEEVTDSPQYSNANIATIW